MKIVKTYDDLCRWIYVKNVRFVWWVEKMADKLIGDRNLNGK